MADVRRSWEDLGFACDQATGVWAEVRASGQPTWEDIGFSQDPTTGLWTESGVRAKHRFDPAQPRDPGGEDGGQWVKHPAGAGALKDELELAGRIELDLGERFVSSSRFEYTSGDDNEVDLLFAVVHSRHGSEVRIGVIPSEDAGKWAAVGKGATAGLSSDELRQARTDLAAASAAADKATVEAEAAWDSGRAPTDPKLLGSAPVASGQFVSANHDDLDWSIHLNDESSWDLNITPTRGQFDGALLDPDDTAALLDDLAEIQDQLDQLD